jgi:Ca2+-transporting ATPase
MRRPVALERLAGVLDGERGLSAAEVTARRARYGPNAILEAPPGGWRELLRETLKDPMIWFLVATGALYAALGELGEASALLAASVPLVTMDAYLHRRTRASTAGLKSRLAAQATVRRDGAEQLIPATELVPGDLAVVGAGEPFPADGLVLRGTALQADESALSGESLPVHKQPLTVVLTPQTASGIEAAHWGFAGTRLLTGQALVRVVYTGGETLYGAIVCSAQQGQQARTPLQQAIGQLVTILLISAAVLCAILAWVRLRQGFGLVDAALSALTLAVAAIPEELWCLPFSSA